MPLNNPAIPFWHNRPPLPVSGDPPVQNHAYVIFDNTPGSGSGETGKVLRVKNVVFTQSNTPMLPQDVEINLIYDHGGVLFYHNLEVATAASGVFYVVIHDPTVDNPPGTTSGLRPVEFIDSDFRCGYVPIQEYLETKLLIVTWTITDAINVGCVATGTLWYDVKGV